MDASSLTKKCERLMALLIGPRNAWWLGVTTLSEVGRHALFGVGGRTLESSVIVMILSNNS
jgi:hypothetical protein